MDEEKLIPSEPRVNEPAQGRSEVETSEECRVSSGGERAQESTPINREQEAKVQSEEGSSLAAMEQSGQSATVPEGLRIVVHVEPGKAGPGEGPKVVVEARGVGSQETGDTRQEPETKGHHQKSEEGEVIPARMLNEFV